MFRSQVLREVVFAQLFEFAALLSVMERRGLLTRGGALEEINRLREKSGTTGQKHYDARAKDGGAHHVEL